MTLTKQSLQNTFAKARETDSPYVFVGLNADGIDELIVIPKRSFDAKETFYLSAYSDELVHVMNKSVYIRGLSYGDVDQVANVL